MIYCPVHQIQENSKLDLSSFFKGFGEVHACRCIYCNKTYIDVRGIKSGVVGHTSKGYDIVNLHKYYSFPKSFYLVTKAQIKKLAQSNVLFEIPEFLVKNKLYRVKSFYEPSMQRYYINEECYKNCIDILDKFLIKIIDERHITVFPYVYKYELLPNELYLLNSNDFEKIIKNKTFIEIHKFTDKKRREYNFFAKYDKDSNKYYISETTYKDIKYLEAEGKIRILYFKNLRVDEKSKKMHKFPGVFCVMEEKNLKQLAIKEKLIECSDFRATDHTCFYIPSRYDKKTKRFYINTKIYERNLDLFNKRNTIIIDFIKFNEGNISVERNLPKVIYVLNNIEMLKLNTILNVQEIENFKNTKYTYFEIPTMFNPQNNVYFLSSKTANDYAKVFNILKIQLIKHQTLSNIVETFKRSNSLNNLKLKKQKNNKNENIDVFPYKASIIDGKVCSKCHHVLERKYSIFHDSSQDINLRMYYCKICQNHFILKEDFDKDKELYTKSIKEISYLDYLKSKNQQSSTGFNKDLYIDQPIVDLSYGKGTFVQIKGSNILVDYSGNKRSYHFPQSFKNGRLRFADKEYQASIMHVINMDEPSQEDNSFYVLRKKVTVQNSSYADVRRIPGLVYKIQLIGSSNNHATKTHPVKDVVVKLAYKNPKSKTFDIVSIPMHYCSRCDKYFDMKQSFLQTLLKYNLDINYFAASFESEIGHPIVFKQMDLREFSKLKLFGYSVGANGLSTGARHELLDFILKIHLMTASEIKSQLQFNIRFIGKKAHMDDAVGDWKMDIDYINEYIRTGKIHWKY